ncbi:hypothetical protein B0H19DRAFT_1383506 [Mycena capillaripes]|nr:hypothetical protein B0H19DRAFT_1383506 [Mycena capillaripes]
MGFDAHSWMNHDPGLLPCIHFPLGPRSTDLHLRFELKSSNPDLLSAHHCGTMPVSYPGVDMPDHFRGDAEVLASTSQLVRSLTRVERLFVGDFDQFAFNHLAMLPSLKLLTALDLRDFVPTTDSLDLDAERLFPSLDDIFLMIESNATAIGWIKLLYACLITEFGLCLAFVSTATETASLHTSLADNLSHRHLRALQIDAIHAHFEEQIAAFSPSQYSIKSHSFRRLFCFHNLSLGDGALLA